MSERLVQTNSACARPLLCVCTKTYSDLPSAQCSVYLSSVGPEYQSPPHSDLPSAPRPPASPRSSLRCTPPCSRAAGAPGSAVSQSLRGSAPRSQQVLAPIRMLSLCRRRWRRRQRHRKFTPVSPEAWAAPRCSHFEKFPPVSEGARLAVTSAHSPLLRG